MYRRQDGFVLDRRGHDGSAAFRLLGTQRPEHGQVVSLGTPRSEADLIGLRPKTASNALARLVQRSAGLAAPPMNTRRIAEPRAEERLHRFDDLAAHRCRRSMVHINGLWHKSI